MQECVDAFVKSRKQALEIATVKETDEHPKRKRRKIDSGDHNAHAVESPPTRRTRASARVAGQKSIPSSQEVIAIDSEDDGDASYTPAPEAEPAEPDDGLVACPMCNKRMKEEAVFPHLDRCDGKPVKESPPLTKLPQPHISQHPVKSQQGQRTASPAKHLPHLNYSLLKDGPLKKKLQELGIPTWGNRQLLVRRHTQWVDIYNANSDSPRPKTERQLLKDLDVWERTQGGHAPGQGQTGPVGVMRKDFDGEEWTGKHKDQFSDLIAQAKAKRQTAAPAEKKTEEEKPDSDAMQGVVTSSTAATNGNTSPKKAPPPISKIDTAAATKAVPPSSSAMSQEATASPVASMLHSAAQDVRRRTSISQSPSTNTNVPGLISTHSIPPNSQSATPAPAHENSWRSPSGGSSSSRKVALPHEDSLAEKMAEAAGEGDEAANMKTVDMFKVPESPINDVEIGAGTGGG